MGAANRTNCNCSVLGRLMGVTTHICFELGCLTSGANRINFNYSK